MSSPQNHDQPRRASASRSETSAEVVSELSDPDAGEGNRGGFPSLSPPPQGTRRLRLVLLVILGLTCLGTAASLFPAASYALSAPEPQELGELATADLGRATTLGTQWVSATGEVSQDGIAFSRKGAASGFVLTRLAERSDLWVLLPTFSSEARFIPPRSFSGRLLRRDQLGLALRPVALLIDRASGKGTDYLLIEGARPDTYRTELVAFFLLAMTGLLSILRFGYLTRRISPASPRSPRLTVGAA